MSLTIRSVVSKDGEVNINANDLLLFIRHPENKNLTTENLCEMIESHKEGAQNSIS